MGLDASGDFFRRDCKIVEAAYAVALEISKQKKPHTTTGILIKPCVLKMADTMPGQVIKRKLALLSLSNGTIQKIVKDLSNDIKCQVVE